MCPSSKIICNQIRIANLILFMEEDLRTKAAPSRTFTNPDKMVEMIRRGNGFRDLASKQAAQHAIMAGRANVDLFLTSEQYERLVGESCSILRSLGRLSIST